MPKTLRAHILSVSPGEDCSRRSSIGNTPRAYRRWVLADTYAGWTGSLGERVATQRLTACIHDSSLPAAELVAQYLPGMFSERVPSAVREHLAAIMSDTHPVGDRARIPLTRHPRSARHIGLMIPALPCSPGRT